MIDITEDLKIYKELEPVWEQYWERFTYEDFVNRDWSGYPKAGDPRIKQFEKAKDRIEDIALHSSAVTVTETALHQLFHKIRQKVLNESLDQNGYIESPDLFDKILDQYNPNDYIRNLSLTKPTISFSLLPSRVVDLISETRHAFCLQLPTACISMCRSTVERVVIDIAVRTLRIDDEGKLEGMGMCKRISLLLDTTISHTSPLRQKINSFMDETSNVIHSNVEADMDMARELYLKCTELIQALYGQYKVQLKK